MAKNMAEYNGLIKLRNAILTSEQANLSIQKAQKNLDWVPTHPHVHRDDSQTEWHRKLEKMKVQFDKNEKRRKLPKKLLHFLTSFGGIFISALLFAIGIYVFSVWNEGIQGDARYGSFCGSMFFVWTGLSLFMILYQVKYKSEKRKLLKKEPIKMRNGRPVYEDPSQEVVNLPIEISLFLIAFILTSIVVVFVWLSSVENTPYSGFDILIALLKGILLQLPFAASVVCWEIYTLKAYDAIDKVGVKSDIDDYSVLYSDKDYQEVKRKVEECEAKRQADYSTRYHDAQNKLESQRQYYRNAIQNYKQVKANCDTYIRNHKLHANQKNIDFINRIITYFDYNRADTIKEAINEIIRDEQYMQLKNQLSAQHQAIMTQMKKQEERVQQLSRQISAEFASLESTIRSESNNIQFAINSSSDTIHRDLRVITDFIS